MAKGEVPEKKAAPLASPYLGWKEPQFQKEKKASSGQKQAWEMRFC